MKEERTRASRHSFFSTGWALASFLLIGAVIVPFILGRDSFLIHILILVYFFGFLATAWGLVGQSGQLSFGHAAFVGLGGYTSTILFMDYGVTPYIGMFAGILVALIFGILIGYPTLRLRGPYFALATLAFGTILETFVMNTEFLGPINLRGAMGLVLPLKDGGDSPAFFQFASKRPYYFIALSMMVGGVLLSFALNRGRIGIYWTAIRSDQDAAESIGINASRYRLLAFLLSCALAAIGGTFYAQYFHYIDPERGIGLSLSMEIVLVGVVGGWQTVTGPMIGSMIIVPLGELIRAQLGGSFLGLHLFIYGALFMIIILCLPKGLNQPVMRVLRRLGRGTGPRNAVSVLDKGERE